MKEEMQEDFTNNEEDFSFIRCLRNISVEPVMFLYMFAFMITSVFEQAFFVDRACRTNLKLNDSICDDLEKQPDEIKTPVQVVVARFLLWNSIASYVVPIIFALFLGAWSDKRGRKLPLLFGLVGKLIYSTMIVVIAFKPELPLESILVLASFPTALTGADIAIFSSSYSYLADITSAEKRTIRITIMDVVYLSALPSGVALGKVLFNTIANKSYGIIFAINASILIIAIIYAFIFLKWTTKSTQEVVWTAGKLAGSRCICCWALFDFLDCDHLKSSFKTIFRQRPGRRRTFLLLFFLSIALYSFQRDERSLFYLYTQLKFRWSANAFSDFRTFQNTCMVIGTLLGYRLLSRVFGLRDEISALIGCASTITARICFIVAYEPWIFYLGGGVVALGSMVASIIRSMVTKTVPLKERGKVLAVFSSCDTGVPVLALPAYSQLYAASMNYFPQAIFLLTISTQAILFCLLLFIRCSLGSDNIEVPEYEISIPIQDKEEENKSESEKN